MKKFAFAIGLAGMLFFTGCGDNEIAKKELTTTKYNITVAECKELSTVIITPPTK